MGLLPDSYYPAPQQSSGVKRVPLQQMGGMAGAIQQMQNVDNGIDMTPVYLQRPQDYQAPNGASDAMDYSDYLGGVIGNSPNADPLSYSDWSKMYGAHHVAQAAAAPAPAPAPAAPSNPAATQAAAGIAAGVGGGAGGGGGAFYAAPQAVQFHAIAPNLIDLNQLGAYFNPDPAVMAQFQAQTDSANNQINNARGEVEREKTAGQGEVAKLPGMYDQTLNTVQQLLNQAGASSDAALAKYGLQGSGAANMAPIGILAQQTHDSYANQVPLLNAGFDERAAQQNGFLTQLGAQMLDNIAQRQTDYTSGLSTSKAGALAQGATENSNIRNQTDQFNASGQSDVDKFNAQAQQAWQQGNAQLAEQYAGLAQQAASQGPSAIDLALKGVYPGETLAQIAAANAPGAANLNFDPYAIAKNMPVQGGVSPIAALQLGIGQPGGFDISQLTGGAVKAYQDMVNKLQSSSNPAQTLQQLQAKYPNYNRTLNLAAMNTGAFAGDFSKMSGLA